MQIGRKSPEPIGFGPSPACIGDEAGERFDNPTCVARAGVENKAMRAPIPRSSSHRSHDGPERATGGRTDDGRAAAAPCRPGPSRQAAADASPRVAQLRAMAAAANRSVADAGPAGPATGLPPGLRAGVEALSGLCMDGVRVHRGSSRPHAVGAHAFAEGRDIHLAPGQDRHLPHEAWHVVQQAQGRVLPTMQLAGGTRVNDDPVLEREADRMGARALGMGAGPDAEVAALPRRGPTQVIQRARHAVVGTMIHHAPRGNQPGPIAQEIWNEFVRSGHVATNRGRMRPSSNATYDWRGNFDDLATKLDAIRAKAGFDAQSFPIFINANQMVSPGLEAQPADHEDQALGIHAFGSSWGMDFFLPDKQPAATYQAALNAWADVEEPGTGRRGKTGTGTMLGQNTATALLRRAATDKLAASRNTAIPHRGLRNALLQRPEVTNKRAEVARSADYVHVVTLDNDVSLDTGDVVREIFEIAEAAMPKKAVEAGIQVTATDYIYDRAGFFPWFAGALDKLGRNRLEAEGYEPYPGEPGLTISYAVSEADAATTFLTSEPFGPEMGAHGTGMSAFKRYAPSEQSVEGKNLRESWRKAIGVGDAKVHRTLAHVDVAESAEQAIKPGKALSALTKAYNKKAAFTPDQIRSLISTDTYHSLLKPRGKAEEKLGVINGVIDAATKALNAVVATAQYPEDLSTLKAPVLLALRALMTEPVTKKRERSDSGSSGKEEEARPISAEGTSASSAKSRERKRRKVEGESEDEQSAEPVTVDPVLEEGAMMEQ